MSNLLLNGDSVEEMSSLPSESVDCCVTSPPYWQMRNYQIEGQYGLEITPSAYINKLVLVFNEVKRLMKPEGVLWVNIGDTYATHGSASKKHSHNFKKANIAAINGIGTLKKPTAKSIGMKEKDLVGIPWMLALALRDSGWYLRQDIIWSKPNPMPDPVKDRCARSHEYIFMLSKGKKYHFDSMEMDKGFSAKRKTVWTIPTRPFKGAHFATFPKELITPCILATCPENGSVLDPFAGSGTTCATAVEHDRGYVGIELNKEYYEIAKKRIQEAEDACGLFI